MCRNMWHKIKEVPQELGKIFTRSKDTDSAAGAEGQSSFRTDNVEEPKSNELADISKCAANGTGSPNEVTPKATQKKDTSFKDRIKKGKSSKLERKILNRWKEEWGAEDKTAETEEEKMTWEDLVISNYELFYEKAKKNRDMNFCLKRIVIIATVSVIVLIAAFGILLFLLTHATTASNSSLQIWGFSVALPINMSITQSISILAFAGVLAAAAMYTIIKVVEIKKYQETWARHRDALYKIQEEMVRYSENLSPYDGANDNELKKKLFKHRFLGILSDNNKKFVDNMENKEASLSDLPAQLNFKEN